MLFQMEAPVVFILPERDAVVGLGDLKPVSRVKLLRFVLRVSHLNLIYIFIWMT